MEALSSTYWMMQCDVAYASESLAVNSWSGLSLGHWWALPAKHLNLRCVCHSQVSQYVPLVVPALCILEGRWIFRQLPSPLTVSITGSQSILQCGLLAWCRPLCLPVREALERRG
jgi:hypothetical protein